MKVVATAPAILFIPMNFIIGISSTTTFNALHF